MQTILVSPRRPAGLACHPTRMKSPRPARRFTRLLSGSLAARPKRLFTAVSLSPSLASQPACPGCNRRMYPTCSRSASARWPVAVQARPQPEVPARTPAYRSRFWSLECSEYIVHRGILDTRTCFLQLTSNKARIPFHRSVAPAP